MLAQLEIRLGRTLALRQPRFVRLANVGLVDVGGIGILLEMRERCGGLDEGKGRRRLQPVPADELEIMPFPTSA